MASKYDKLLKELEQPTAKEPVKTPVSKYDKLTGELEGQPVPEQLETTLTPKQQKRIESAERFREGGVGKVFGTLGLAEDPTELREKFERRQELRGMPIGKRIVGELTDIGKAGVEAGAKAAPWLIPGGKAFQVVKGVPKLVKTAKVAAPLLQRAGISGTARIAEELAQGEDIKSAGLKGIGTALLEGTIGGAVPVAKKLVKEALPVLSKVRGYAVDQAIKDPTILSETQPQVIDVGRKALSALEEFSQKARNNYLKASEKLIPKKMFINTNAVKDKLGKLGLSPDTVSKQLKSVKNNEALDLSDDAIDRFVQGRTLNFTEAKTINSLLHDKAAFRFLEGGLPAKLGNIKSALLGNIESAVPGFREMNKQFAKDMKLLSSVKNKVADKAGDIGQKEGFLYQIGEQLGGVKRKRTDLIEQLQKIDNVVSDKNKFLKQLGKSVAAEEFEKLPMSNLLNTLTLFGSVGAAGLAGMGVGGTTGALLPAGAALYSLMGRTPGGTAAQILGGKKLAQKLAKPTVKPLIERAGFGISRLFD